MIEGDETPKQRKKLSLYQYKQRVIFYLMIICRWDRKTARGVVFSSHEFLKERWVAKVFPASTAKLIHKQFEEILSEIKEKKDADRNQ